MPRAVHFEKDGTVRYSDEITKIAITKQGDTYTIYDYTSGLMTKNMTKSEVNKHLRTYKRLFDEFAARNYGNNAIGLTDRDVRGQTVSAEAARKALPDTLSAYTEEEKRHIQAKSDSVIATTLNDVITFFKRAATDTSNKAGTMYIGKISTKTAAKIQRETGINTFNKSIALNAHDIRHMLKEHGDAETERLRGQEAISENNIEYVVRTIAEPDEVTAQTDEKSGVTTLIFKKEIEGRTTAITIFSEKRKTLTLKTAWIIKNGQHISPPFDAKAPNTTPKSELSLDTVLTDSISQTTPDVNTSSKNNSNERRALPETPASKSAKFDAYARENLEGYGGLSDAGKSMIRKLIRDGRANGVAEDVILSAARVSARSGLDVVFSKEGARGGDGRIEGNTVYIDPTAAGERIRSKLLLHEVGHAIVRSKKGKRLIAEAFKQISPERSQEIAERYQKFYQKQGVSMEEYVPIINEEIAMHHIEDVLGNANAWEYILSKEQTMGQRFLSFFKGASEAYSADQKLSRTARKLLRTYKKLFDEFAARNRGSNGVDAAAVSFMNSEKMHDTDKRYALSSNAESDVDTALTNISYREDVRLTDASPSIIISQKGVRDLPMLMKASHIRENIFTEQEAQNMGLKADEHTHYHGLGKELFLKIIDGLDGVTLAYRGTKNASNASRRQNYFLLISQYKDANGNAINVPIYINETGQHNRVFIDTNKIATVFGRKQFAEYINKEIKNGNLVRIKNRNTQASERTALIAGGYSENVSTNSISQNPQDVNTSSKNNSDERMALKDDAGIEATKKNAGNPYSYETLISKPDMVITALEEDVPRDANGKISRARVRAKGLANVRKQNNSKNTEEFSYARCDDTGTDIRVNINGINHGLDRRIETNGKAAIIIGDLIKNAIKVNEVNSLSQGHEGDYVLLSCFSEGTDLYGTSIYVDRLSNEVTGMDSIDILYSANGKKIGTAAPNARVSDRSPSLTVPTISISQLLEKCNTKFKDIFSKDVYEHFGTEKDTSTKLGSTTRYALQETPAKKSTKSANPDADSAAYWKNEYENLKGRDRLLGLLMSKAQQMKELKLGTFANSTQYESEVFRKSIESLAKIQFRGNLNVSGTRRIIKDLRSWYQESNSMLGYVDERNPGYYVKGVAEMMDALANGEKGFTKNDLSMLYDVMSYFVNFVKTWGKVYRQGKWIDAETEARRYVDVLHTNAQIKGGIANKFSGSTYAQTFFDPMSVARRMDLISSTFAETLR